MYKNNSSNSTFKKKNVTLFLKDQQLGEVRPPNVSNSNSKMTPN